MPLIHALVGLVAFAVWGYAVFPAVIDSIIVPAGGAALGASGKLIIGVNCGIVGMVSFFFGAVLPDRIAARRKAVVGVGAATVVLALLGGIVLAMTLSALR